MESYRDVGRKLSNWNRWGPDDELGTINHITPQRRLAAAGLVRRGVTFDLGIPFSPDGPQPGGQRANPVHLMRETGHEQTFPTGLRFADDVVFMALQCATQWDALSHVYYDDQLYNGYPASSIDSFGASRNAVDKLGRDIAGRGVLLDVARLHGVDHLPARHVVTPDELDRAAELQGVSVGPGDVLLLRTGWRRVFTETGDPALFMADEPGIGLAACEWLHGKDVAAVAADNWALEVLPGETDELLPVHCVLIRDMGMPIGEIFDFEALAADCAEDGVWEFLFVGPALKFARAVGSPVNPLAIK